MFKFRGCWLVLSAVLMFPIMGSAQVYISVNVPPPELPVYDQPPVPGDGYVWTPGYWGWNDDYQDYYWVPGTWVSAPEPDYLWTPGYWGAEGAIFLWHVGYWGPHVGFYGGVNYGHGYGGEGYEGGYWQHGRLFYNRSVTNVNNTYVTNVYNRTVINNVTVNRVSYNGGEGGIRAQPSSAQFAAARENHISVTPVQRQHEVAARAEPSLRVSENRGNPPIAATPRPGALVGAGVVPARRGGGLDVRPTGPTAGSRAITVPRTAAPDGRMLPPRPENPQAPRSGIEGRQRDQAPELRNNPAAPRPAQQSPPAQQRPPESQRAPEPRRPPVQQWQQPAPRPPEPQRAPEPQRPPEQPRPAEPRAMPQPREQAVERRAPEQSQPQRPAQPPPSPPRPSAPRNPDRPSEH